MCCEGKNAKDGFAPTGTWLDLTEKDTFTAEEIAAAEGCDARTVQRRVQDGSFGPLPYRGMSGSLRIPRLAIVHYLERGRRR